MAGRPRKTEFLHVGPCSALPSRVLQQPGLSFLASELTSLEMLHVSISGKLVPNDEFPDVLLLVTKCLCTVTTCPHSKLSSLLDHSDTREYADTKGCCAFCSGLWGASSTVSGSSIYFFPTVTQIPHRTGTRTCETAASGGLHRGQAAAHIPSSWPWIKIRQQEHRWKTFLTSFFLFYLFSEGSHIQSKRLNNLFFKRIKNSF